MRALMSTRVLLLRISIWMFALAVVFGALVDQTTLLELQRDWQSKSSPSEHEFVKQTRAFYHKNTVDVFANNLMGLISHESGDFVLASRYFKTACEESNFQNLEYVRKFAGSQNLVNARETVDVLTSVLQKDLLQGELISELTHWLSLICREVPNPLFEALRIVHQLPTVHTLWVVYAESALRLSRSDHFNASEAAAVTEYGLTMYPRSCELLLLRATLYLQEGSFACAGELYRAANQVKGMFTHQFDPTQYFDELVQLTFSSADSDMSQCTPFLRAHNTDQYQTLYSSITSTVGSYWIHLSTHHTTPAHFTPLLSRSVSTATTEYPNGITTTKYLPSLQIGCSSPIDCVRPGFIIVDAAEAISTHYVTMVYNLHMIETGSVGVVYSSHTLEHLSYNIPPATCVTYPVSSSAGEDRGCYSELDAALAEWRRVLATGGTLLVSVPDMMVLARHFLASTGNRHNRNTLRGIIYGGQLDEYDLHKNAFFFEYLSELLVSHGFCDTSKVQRFGMFADSSELTMGNSDEMLSLNIRATAC